MTYPIRGDNEIVERQGGSSGETAQGLLADVPRLVSWAARSLNEMSPSSSCLANWCARLGGVIGRMRVLDPGGREGPRL